MAATFDTAEVEASLGEVDGPITLIGSGSFKVAYRVERAGRIDALKIIKAPVEAISDLESDELETELARARREMEFLATSDSPYFARMTEPPSIRAIGGRTYVSYCEEYLPGGSLRAKLAAAPLSEEAVRLILVDLLRAVHALWTSHKAVHRDIKPENVMLDADGKLKLIDFGATLFSALSSLTKSDLTSPGTEFYAAPEQYEKRRHALVDTRTDLFSVGIVAFQAGTARLPFGSRFNAAEYYRNMTDEHFQPALAPLVGDLAEVIGRCLRPRQHQRFAHAQAALHVLGETV